MGCRGVGICVRGMLGGLLCWEFGDGDGCFVGGGEFFGIAT